MAKYQPVAGDSAIIASDIREPVCTHVHEYHLDHILIHYSQIHIHAMDIKILSALQFHFFFISFLFNSIDAKRANRTETQIPTFSYLYEYISLLLFIYIYIG